MPEKLVILSDRTGLIDHLINAGDRALTDGLNSLLAHQWRGSVLSGGWKNFPYFSIRALSPDADRKQIRRVFDRWCEKIDRADPNRGRRQLALLARWEKSRLQNNPCIQALDRYLKKTRTREIIETLSPYACQAAFRCRFRALIEAANTVVFNGGGLIADHLAFYLPGYLLELYYARKKGKPVVTLNQSIAVRSRRLQAMVSEVYRDLAYHIVREPLSRQRLVDLGADPGRIRVAPDTAFAVASQHEAPESRGPGVEPGTRPKRIALIPRGDRGLHLAFWEAICHWGLVDRSYRLTAVHTCRAHDRPLIKRLRQRLAIEEIDAHGDYRRIIEALGRFDCVITDRYHGVIFAILASTPVIGLKSTTFKIDGLFELCRYPFGAIDIDGPDAVRRVQHNADQIFKDLARWHAAMASIRRDMQDRVMHAYADISELAGAR